MGTLENCGICHLPVLELQIQHFNGVRGYKTVNEAEGWTILQHHRLRELLAFHADGASIGAGHEDTQLTPYPGGGCLSVTSDSHISIPDAEFVATVHDELATSGHVPLARIVDKLEIRDKLHWPAVLTSGEFVFSRQLRGDWGTTSFSARLRYKKFLPDVVLARWKAL
jgi:hypothetical protein